MTTIVGISKAGRMLDPTGRPIRAGAGMRIFDVDMRMATTESPEASIITGMMSAMGGTTRTMGIGVLTATIVRDTATKGTTMAQDA
jgi:hypothetical protein